jgi:phage shock protein PspC (stress-responsive transcriptional regulator)
MNKTIIININGFVFHIEEDAYEILKTYMTDVKRHFLNSADSHEITTDIENRIAEMFTDILARDNKQVVLEQDVTAVIEQMGSVADFDYPEDDGSRPNDAFTYATNTRTLFRDGEDHLLGGVCSGLANYFGTEPVWIRLVFAIAVIFAGTGLFLYIILWIVVPKAKSRADRMAMKGEKLNLQGFKKNLEDEMSAVRGHFSDLGQEAKPFIYKTRDFASDFFHHLGVFINGAGKVLIKFIGIAVLLSCFGALIALIVTIIGFLAYGKMGLYHVFPFNMLESQLNPLVLSTAFLVLAIPLLAVIMVIISAVFNSNGLNKTSGSTLLVLWLLALGIVLYYSARVSANFRHGASFSQSIVIKPTPGNIYYLRLNDVKYISPEDSIRFRLKDRFNGKIILDANDDNEDNFETPDNVNISIEKSDVNQPVLVESFSARGFDYGNALINAQNTTYQFSQIDSVLKFNRHLEKPLNRLWRNQEIHLTLKVPLNAILVIDRDLQNYLHNVNVYECKDINKKPDAQTANFIMTADGLQCKVDTLLTKKPLDTVKPL